MFQCMYISCMYNLSVCIICVYVSMYVYVFMYVLHYTGSKFGDHKRFIIVSVSICILYVR